MNAKDLAAIRERLRRAPDYDGPETDADALLAHIDALTAKVEGLPVIRDWTDPGDGPELLDRAAVLAILRGEA